MKTWTRMFAFTFLVVSGTAACEGGSTDPNATDQAALLADAALVAADGMFQDLNHMQSPNTWGDGGSAPEAAPIEFEGSTSFSKTVTFYDTLGAVQTRYDPLGTGSMHVVADLERKATHSFWSADIKRHRDMMVTGLGGRETQRTWNGASSGDVFKSRHPEDGIVRTYDMETSATINQVVRAVPRGDHPYPLSGSITRIIHAVITKDGVTEERDITATITFDGTRFATMSVDGETWEIDLDEKGVRRRFRKP